jgi:peptidoglycan lytic transglycosylase
MRILVSSALAVAALGLLAVSPANAAPHWECMGTMVACIDSPAKFARAAYKTRDHGRSYASRGERRVTSRRTRSYETASYEPKQRRSNSRAASFSKTAYSGGSYSGMASYYGSESGSRTASGARFVPSAMTAAHRTLPFGTKVRVTNRRNGRSVIVTINDRGPFIRGRVIDLSSGAAGVIGMRSSGVAPVSLEVLGRS